MPAGDVWGNAWGASWNGAWRIAAVPPVEVPVEPQVRMYSGGSYRVRDQDVQDLLRLLYPERKLRKKRKRLTPDEFEKAAMAVLNFGMPDPLPEPARRIVIDHAGEIVRAQARRADMQATVQALLQMAADAAEAQRMADDEEDVMLLLLAA